MTGANRLPRQKYRRESLVTLGVDTQSDCFIWLLCGWGRRNEVWMLATGEIMGDMASDGPWNELEALLDRLWTDAEGNAYRPLTVCLDVQGDHYQRTVAFCKATGWKRVRGVRGLGLDKRRSGNAGVSIIRNVYQDKTLRVPIQNLDTDAAKTMVSTMLAREKKGRASSIFLVARAVRTCAGSIWQACRSLPPSTEPKR